MIDNGTCKNKEEGASRLDLGSLVYSPSMVQHEHGGVYLLIDPKSPNWVSTNMLGSAVVRRCDGRHTVREVAEQVSLEHGISATEVLDFISQASESGILTDKPDVSPAYTGRSQAIAPSVLEELWIYTNNSCPLHCRHCLVNGGAQTGANMTAGEIKNLVDAALALGAGRIYFTGGEPFLRKDLLELVEYTAARAQVVILTSGVLMTDELAGRLKNVSRGNLIIQVSLEGPDAPTNDAIRGDGSFELALRGIRALLQAGIVPVVTSTLTRLNYLKAPETTRFLARLGIRDHHILWLHQCGRARECNDELLLSGEEIAQTMRLLKQAASEAGIVVDNSESLSARIKGRGRKHDLCNSCYGVLAVNTDSHVYPCASLVGTPEFDCGSVREQSLKDIWLMSPKTNWVRGNSVQKKAGCSSCYLKFFCGGGCFAQSYSSYAAAQGSGCIMAPDPYCEVYRSQLLELIWESARPSSAEKTEEYPALYRVMPLKRCECDSAEYRVLDASHNVGTYHCSCVLAMDAEEKPGGNQIGK